MIISQDSFDFILKEISNRTMVDIDTIMGSSRKKRAVLARHTAIIVLRDLGYSLTEIGHLLGKDHTTVLYAVQTFPGRGGELSDLAGSIVSSVKCGDDGTGLKKVSIQ